MNNINEYYKNTIVFINSLVIKIDEIRIHQNYHTYVKNGLVPPTKYTSKYYQNITAVLNKNDYPVVLPSGDVLTREYLNANLYFKEVLMKYGVEFNNLIVANPGMGDYIRGCITDVEIDLVKTSENYKILSYKQGYLQENELSIIPKLEKFIHNYFTTYGNRKLMIDNLFLPAQLSELYPALVLYTITLKFGNIKTHKVDEFHLSNSLLSYKDTYTYSKIFDLSTNIWLYGNVDRLKHNVGKNKILDEVLLKVLDVNNYGVGNLRSEKLKPVFNQTDFEDYTKEFYKNDYRLTITDRNSSNYNISNKAYTVDVFSNILINNKLITNYPASRFNIENEYLKQVDDIQLTDIFLLDQPEKINVHEYNMFSFLISNLIFIIRNNKPSFVIDFYNPLDTKLYKLNMEDIENIIIYNLISLYNIPVGDMYLKCNGIYGSNTIDKNTILKQTWYKTRIAPVLDYILDIPNLNILPNNPTTLLYKLSAIRQIDLRAWFTMSNIVDNTAKADIKYMMSNILNNKEFLYNTTDVVDYLNSNKLTGFMSNITIGSLSDIITSVTGIEVDSTKLIVENFSKVINFFDNFTSYTVDLTMDNEFLDKEILNSTSGGINMGYKPFLEIKDTSVKFYEELDTYILATGFLDTVLDYTLNDNDIVNIADVSNSLPCLFSQEDISNIEYTSKTKLLRGKKYVVTGNVLNLLDANLYYSIDNQVTDSKTVKETMPIISDSDNISKDMFMTIAPFINYRGSKYLITGILVDNVEENVSTMSYLREDLVLRVTGSYTPYVAATDSISSVNIIAMPKLLDRNVYSPVSNIIGTDDNTINTISENSDTDVSLTGTVGDVVGYDNDVIIMDIDVVVNNK